jgi:hypothetical protein
VAHGFNLINWGSGNKRRHQAVTKEVYSEAAEWLKSEAYASLRTQRNKEQRQTGNIKFFYIYATSQNAFSILKLEAGQRNRKNCYTSPRTRYIGKH